MDDLTLANDILERFSHYRTCSLFRMQDEGIVFVREKPFLKHLAPGPEHLVAIVPKGSEVPDDIHCDLYEADEPEVVFAMVHNTLASIRWKRSDMVSIHARIHPTAVIGASSIKIVQAKNGRRIDLIHTGHVAIEDDVHIGPQAVVHRGCLDETRIRRGARIAALSSVGHNVEIGQRVILAVGSLVAGSTKIGNDCYIGLGARVRNNIHVAPGTLIGMGANVVKAIDEPGVYLGNPARRVGPWDGSWVTKLKGERSKVEGDRTI